MPYCMMCLRILQYIVAISLHSKKLAKLRTRDLYSRMTGILTKTTNNVANLYTVFIQIKAGLYKIWKGLI